MPPRKAPTYAFVNRTSKQPNFTGEHLSTVRSHSARLQWQQERQSFKRNKKGIQRGSWALQHQSQLDPRFRGHDLEGEDQDYEVDRVMEMLNVRPFSGRVPSDSLRRDPFDTFPAPATTEVYLAIDHYIQVIASQYGAFVTPVDYVGNGLLDAVLPVSLQSVYLFHALVAHSRLMHLMAKDGSGIEDTVVIYHRGQALAALQLAVQDVKDDTVPLAVIQLLQLEFRSGNTRAVALHTAGLQQIMLRRKSVRPATLLSRVVTMMINSTSASSILKQEHAKLSRSQPGDIPISNTAPTPTLGSDLKASVRAHMADSLPSSLRIAVSVLPPGFQDVILASLVSFDVIKLVVSVSDSMDRPGQAVAAWIQHVPQIQSSLSHKSRHPTFLDPWLYWAVLAHIFQHCPISHRQEHVPQIQDLEHHVIQSLASRTDVTHVLQIIDAEAISLGAGNFAVRDCAVWSLMSVAGAGNRARKDSLLGISAVTTSGNEKTPDRPAMKLMEKIRWMMAFDKQQVASDANHEWRVLDKILVRFCSPDWLRGEWEAMYKQVFSGSARDGYHSA